MNTLDIILIIILALAALNGFRAGLVVSVSRIVGLGVGFAAAVFYCRPASVYFEERFAITEKLGPLLESMINFPVHVSGENISSFIERSLAGMSGMFAANDCMFLEKLIELLQTSSDSIEQALGSIITFTVMDILIFLIILFVVEKITAMAGFFVSRAFSYTFVGVIDRVGGVFFGLVRGIITITLLIAVLIPLQAFGSIIWGSGSEGVLFNLLQTSQVVSYLGYAAEYLSSYFLQNAPPVNLI